jgi:GLPGLI family protein
MKCYVLVGTLLLFSAAALAQLKEGKIVYERTTQFQIMIEDDNPAMQNLPKERKDKFELLFANGQSLWRPMPDEPDAGNMVFNNGNGGEIRIMMAGSNDVTYNNFAQQKRVELRELGTKQYVIEDSIKRMSWKLGGETKDILGYTCRKAVTQRTQNSVRVNMDNGKLTRVPTIDTLNIVAWFTDAIPSFGGPENYQGQLPGTILELDVNNGRSSFKAVEVSPKVEVKEIKEPKGKKITQVQFDAEREKMMKEMEANGGGTFTREIRD